MMRFYGKICVLQTLAHLKDRRKNSESKCAPLNLLPLQVSHSDLLIFMLLTFGIKNYTKLELSDPAVVDIIDYLIPLRYSSLLEQVEQNRK